VNRAALEQRVVERLRGYAAQDPKAWLPVVGTCDSASAPHGLAVEFFGAEPRRGQLEVLARALFQLANTGAIEVATFSSVKGVGRLPSRPLRQGGQTHFSLTNHQILRSNVLAFGARLVT
jgi:hypothetical protein